MDPGHKARKNPSDNADLGFLRIMQLNVEGLSAAKRHIIESLAETHHIDVICLQETHVNDDKSDDGGGGSSSRGALACRACKTICLLEWETPTFVSVYLWRLNSPDLNPVDYTEFVEK